MFGKRLRMTREARGLTQEALGELLGVSKQHVYRWEKSGNEPNAKTLREMAQHLSVSADYLLGLVDEFNGHVDIEAITPAEWRVIRALRSGMIRDAMQAAVDATEGVN